MAKELNGTVLLSRFLVNLNQRVFVDDVIAFPDKLWITNFSTGFFFIFVGLLKLTPQINEDAHREVRKQFVQFSKVIAGPELLHNFTIRLSRINLFYTMSQSAPSDRLTALTFSVETTCFAGLMRFICSSFLTVGSVRLYGNISSYGTSLL